MMFVPHMNFTYGPARPVMEIALLLYVADIRTTQQTLDGLPRAVTEIDLLSYI
jgi:hypothetical protein